MLPPTDKSLSKLLGEAPVLPDRALNLLESLCIPAKENLQPPNGDRITQGLSAVWVLILLRPPMRSKCLEIALKVVAFYIGFVPELKLTLHVYCP